MGLQKGQEILPNAVNVSLTFKKFTYHNHVQYETELAWYRSVLAVP